MATCDICWDIFKQEDLKYQYTSICTSCMYILEHSKDEYLSNTLSNIKAIDNTADVFYIKSKHMMMDYIDDIGEIDVDELKELKQEHIQVMEKFRVENAKISTKILIEQVKDEIVKQKGISQKDLIDRYKVSMKVVKAYRKSSICEAKRNGKRITYSLEDVENMFKLQSIYRRFRYEYDDIRTGVEHLKRVCNYYRVDYKDIARRSDYECI